MSAISGAAAVLFLAMAAQWVAWRLRIPAILLLLATGLVLGPGLRLLDVEALLGHNLETVVGLSVAVILFEGGLSLKWSEIRAHGPVVARLVTTGVVVTGVIGTLAAVWLLDLSWGVALVLGTVLTVSGPTVVLPLLHHIRPDKESAAVLRWEGILIDPVGALLAVLAFEAVLAGGGAHSAEVALAGLAKAVAFGGAIGLGAGALITFLEGRFLVPDALGAGVGLASVVAAYAVADIVQPESGLFAVTVMGVFLANQRWADIRHLLDFKEDLSQILLGVLFVLLAASVEREAILSLDGKALLFVAILVVIARPLAVALSTRGSSLTWRQRIFLSWMAPRGIVAAAAAAFFALRLQAAGVPGGEMLVPVTFLTIVATVILYAVTARPLARLLGVAGPAPNGVLIVGANAVSRALARPLQDAGYEALLVDTNADAVSAANMAGLTAVLADALDPHFEERHGVEGLGSMWGVTPNRTTNSLAAVRFADAFGRGGVFQIAVADDEHMEPHLRGRLLWNGRLTYSAMRDRLRDGWRVSKTPITEQFTLDDWRAEHSDKALGLYRITSDARVRVFAEDASFNAEAGDILVALTPPRPKPSVPNAPEAAD